MDSDIPICQSQTKYIIANSKQTASKQQANDKANDNEPHYRKC
jgi:hypothetical protein